MWATAGGGGRLRFETTLGQAKYQPPVLKSENARGVSGSAETRLRSQHQRSHLASSRLGPKKYRFRADQPRLARPQPYFTGTVLWSWNWGWEAAWSYERNAAGNVAEREELRKIEISSWNRKTNSIQANFRARKWACQTQGWVLGKRYPIEILRRAKYSAK